MIVFGFLFAALYITTPFPVLGSIIFSMSSVLTVNPYSFPIKLPVTLYEMLSVIYFSGFLDNCASHLLKVISLNELPTRPSYGIKNENCKVSPPSKMVARPIHPSFTTEYLRTSNDRSSVLLVALKMVSEILSKSDIACSEKLDNLLSKLIGLFL